VKRAEIGNIVFPTKN